MGVELEELGAQVQFQLPVLEAEEKAQLGLLKVVKGKRAVFVSADQQAVVRSQRVLREVDRRREKKAEDLAQIQAMILVYLVPKEGFVGHLLQRYQTYLQ